MAGGGRTRSGAVVRADCVEGLTEPGWSALTAYGIRTVIDLRNHDELGSDVAPRPDNLDTVHLPLDDIDDTEFWGIAGTTTPSTRPPSITGLTSSASRRAALGSSRRSPERAPAASSFTA